MSDKYTCMKCKCAGAKTLVPFKIVEDRDGMSVKFRGQLCERCFKELFEDKSELQGEDERSKR